MSGIARQVWLAVRPVTRQQRFLWWCGALLTASGLVHAVVALVDGGAWWGPVSWRKPTVFGLSFGILLWSVVWVMRQLSDRRWGWIPAGLLGAASIVEVALITAQRWRGVPSHFNPTPGFDAAAWSVMGTSIIAVVVAVVMLLGWSVVRFRGTPTARVAVLAGLLFVLASGAIGRDLAAYGEATVTATGHVPSSIVFGAAGSPKLAHALGLHGLQVLALLAIGLDMGRLAARTRLRLILLGTAGHAALFAAVTATAYAGRAWIAPAPPMAALALAGAAAVLFAAAVAVKSIWDAGPAGDDGRDGARRPRFAVMR